MARQEYLTKESLGTFLGNLEWRVSILKKLIEQLPEDFKFPVTPRLQDEELDVLAKTYTGTGCRGKA